MTVYALPLMVSKPVPDEAKLTAPVKLVPAAFIPTLTLPLPGSRSRVAVPFTFMAALMLTSLVAVSFSSWADHVTVSFTLMLPSLPLPSVLERLILPPARFEERVVPLMSPPLEAMV